MIIPQCLVTGAGLTYDRLFHYILDNDHRTLHSLLLRERVNRYTLLVREHIVLNSKSSLSVYIG